MAVSQLTSNILVALTLILVVVLVRTIAFARINWKLRRALRHHPEDVPALAAKIGFKPWIYDLWSWSLLALAIGLALLGTQGSAEDRGSVRDMALVTAVSGVVMLAYIQLRRRRSKRHAAGLTLD